MKQPRFEVYLHSVLTDAQIGLLKESLLAGRAVYFYGAEGTGKSVLCSVLHRCGFDAASMRMSQGVLHTPACRRMFLPMLSHCRRIHAA